MIKISVCCVTYNRPKFLGELIQSFLMQTYPASHRELIILDDAGQYGNLQGDGWQIVSFPRRIASLGEKRNTSVSLTSPDFTHIAIADDDDILLPWWLETHVKHLEQGARWTVGNTAYWSENQQITGKWHYREGDIWMLHPGQVFEKEIFWKVHGYPYVSGWEDRDLFYRWIDEGFKAQNVLNDESKPYLIYRRFTETCHMSCVPLESYQKDFQPVLPKAELQIGWTRDYLFDIDQYEKSHS